MILKNILGITLSLCLLFFSSCKSKDLAKQCAEKYPCAVSKEVIDSIVHIVDTFVRYQPLPSPIIRCYEYKENKQIELLFYPCKCLNSIDTVYKSKSILDTAKIIDLSGQLSRLKKDSAIIAKKLVESESRYDKKYYFFRNGFLLMLLLILIIIGLLVWRK